MAVIDLYASSKALAESQGRAGNAAMTSKPGDVTHFNEKGSRAMADLVIQDLLVAVPQLQSHLQKP